MQSQYWRLQEELDARSGQESPVWSETRAWRAASCGTASEAATRGMDHAAQAVFVTADVNNFVECRAVSHRFLDTGLSAFGRPHFPREADSSRTWLLYEAIPLIP